MFGLFKPQNPIVNMTPSEVAQGLKSQEIVLIDVREPSEFAAEHIKGAMSLPLSHLTAPKLESILSEAKGRTVVMQCLAGGRSAQGVGACRNFGAPVDHHLHGGINAWKAAGLPTVRG